MRNRAIEAKGPLLRRTAREDLVVAFHEAGHAVAAYILGLPIAHATIEPEILPDMGPTSGHVAYDRRRGRSRAETHGIALLCMVTAFAGPAAQRALAPRSRIGGPGHGALYDRENAQAAARLLSLSACPRAEGGLTQWAQAEARSLVGRNRALVEALATELVSRRTMTGGEIVAFLDPLREEQARLAWEYRQGLDADALRRIAEEAVAPACTAKPRKPKRADVARAMLDVMADAMAEGVAPEPQELQAAVLRTLTIQGFSEHDAVRKITAVIGARRPFVGWRPVNATSKIEGE